MLRFLFFLLLAFALLGDARIFLFVMNRLVFGSHRHEKSPWAPLMWITPVVLLILTSLFWPLHRWIDWMLRRDIIDRVTPEAIERVDWDTMLGKIGLGWLMIAAAVGVY